MIRKRCPRCKVNRAFKFFQVRPDGRPQAYCKECQRDYDGERRAKKRRQLIENPPRPRYVVPAVVRWLCPPVSIPRGVARTVATKFPDVEEGTIPTL